jgi:hypothetical protein
MKYIKTYESSTDDNFCWLVSTKQPYFTVALKKIGMPHFDIISFVSLFEGDEIIQIYKNGDIWTWGEEYRPKNGKFMGDVEVSDWEVDAYKYNL